MNPRMDQGLPRLDAAALTAMFAANRIAIQLERIAMVSRERDRFVLPDNVRSEVLGIVSAALCDWAVSLGDAARPADLRAGTAALRLEAQAIATLIGSGADLLRVADRARRWADAVKGWARITGGMAL